MYNSEADGYKEGKTISNIMTIYKDVVTFRDGVWFNMTN